MRDQKYISTSEAAEQLGIGLHAVRRLLEREKINGERIAGKVLIANDSALKKEIAARSDIRKKLGVSDPEKQPTMQDVVRLLKVIEKQNDTILGVLKIKR